MGWFYWNRCWNAARRRDRVVQLRFQLRHQTEQDRKKFALSKLEEIHELLSDYKRSYQMLTAEMLKRFAGEDFAELPEQQAIPRKS